jgi:glycosyltransferase involved in cell wall biosynthesis
MTRRGWQCQIVNVWSEADIPFRAKAEAAGVAYHGIVSSKRFDYAVVRQLRDIFRAESNLVVHSNGYKSDLYSLMASRGGNNGLVTTVHGWTSEDAKVRAYEKLQAFLWRFYDRVFCVSAQYRDIAQGKGVPAEKLHLLYNGIVDRELPPRPADASDAAVNIGIVGRLSIEKGHDFFLRVAKQVLAKAPEARFLIAGDGLERAGLEKLTATLGITKQVQFLGHVDDMPAVYAQMDIMAITSHREGLPIVLLEAMLARIPIVSLPVGGVVEVIEDGRGGILVGEPGERDESKFAEALLGLIEDKAARAALGESGRQRILESFTFEHRINTIAAHYTALLPQGADTSEASATC